MQKYASAPLAELSIAVQFGAPLGLSPELAIRIHAELADRYPKLEFKQPIGALGGAGPLGSLGGGIPQMIPVAGEDIHPRYWISSEDEYFLVQFQPDLVAFNWRKRTVPGEAPKVAYPGFEAMALQHDELVKLVLKSCGVKEPPPISAINLFYDNVWTIDPEGQGISTFFAFWKTVGIPKTIGPDVRFAAKIDDELLGPIARVDINAVTAAALVSEKPIPVARLVLSAVGHPQAYSQVQPSLNKLHDHVTGLFEKLITEETRKSWQ